MHSGKHFDWIIKYVSVFVVCVMIGAIGRLSVIQLGFDEFTANISFVVVTSLMVIVFAVVRTLLEAVFFGIGKLLYLSKKNMKAPETKSKLGSDIDKIKAEQEKIIKDKVQEQKESLIAYTKKTFAPYISKEDLILLCSYIEKYFQKEQISKLHPIPVDGLAPLDIYHFGWNIWNFKKVSNQTELALFLKSVFQDVLKDAEVETIKRHLKDDESKGIIKIEKDILAE